MSDVNSQLNEAPDCYPTFDEFNSIKAGKQKMTSINPRLNRTHQGRNGDYPVKIRIIRKRCKRELMTPHRLHEGELDTHTGQMVYRKEHNRRPETISEVNRYLSNVTAILKMLDDALYAEKGEAYTVDDLVNAYYRRGDLTQMFVYADSVIGELNDAGREGTSGNYTSAFRSFATFLGHRNFSFEAFNCEVVDRYADFLKKRGNHPNTVVFYLKQLRSVYNKALKDHIVKTDLSPFRNQSMKEEKTEKRAISKKDIQRIANADLSGFGYYYTLARDLFLFSFYTRGMAFVDMCKLTHANIEGNYLCYRRRKTGQPLRILIEKPLKALLARYADRHSCYLLPMLRQDDSHKGRRNMQSKLNKHIHLLGIYLGFSAPLQFYVARHSWATLARNSGVDISVISCGMGHTSEKTTRIYLAEMDPRKIDDANRKVINEVIYNVIGR